MQLFTLWRYAIGLSGLAALLLPMNVVQQQPKPYKVTITEQEPEFTENQAAVDSKVRIFYRYGAMDESHHIGMNFRVLIDHNPIGDCVGTLFSIDGQVRSPQNLKTLQNLPEAVGPFQKKRHGGRTWWINGDIKVTLVLEVFPGMPSQAKPGIAVQRQMDTLLVKYTIENRGDVAHMVGCRPVFHTLVGGTFASPMTHPEKTLKGIVLERTFMPSFLENPVRSHLKGPGFRAVYTLKVNNTMEAPSKVVLTKKDYVDPTVWDLKAVQSEGNSACAIYWGPLEIAPHSKREVALGYGNGIPCLEDGRVRAEFAGSFEPSKRFTITAYVASPVGGQRLTLLLPESIERIDGDATQIVPLSDATDHSVVMWHCRVKEVGVHKIQIRSNSGITNTWTIAVAPPD